LRFLHSIGIADFMGVMDEIMILSIHQKIKQVQIDALCAVITADNPWFEDLLGVPTINHPHVESNATC
jgi:hypothetical protein